MLTIDESNTSEAMRISGGHTKGGEFGRTSGINQPRTRSRAGQTIAFDDRDACTGSRRTDRAGQTGWPRSDDDDVDHITPIAI